MSELWGLKKKKPFSAEAKVSIRRGQSLEPVACARFWEFARERKMNIRIEESSFERSDTYPRLGATPDGVVHEVFHGWILAKKGSQCLFRHCDGFFVLTEEETAKAINASTEKNEVPTQFISESYDMLKQGWSLEHASFKKNATYFNRSVLEIKCPKKMPSQVLLYYMPQLHLEMFVTGTRQAYFVAYTNNEQKENLRVWKIRFNECFFSRLMECIECMQCVQKNGLKATPFAVFFPLFDDLKRTYMQSHKNRHDFITAFFKPRKMSYSTEYNKYGVIEQFKKHLH